MVGQGVSRLVDPICNEEHKVLALTAHTPESERFE